MKCSNCGKDIEQEDVYCPFCGKKVESSVNDVKSEEQNVVPDEGNDNVEKNIENNEKVEENKIDEIETDKVTKERPKRPSIITIIIYIAIIAIMVVVILISVFSSMDSKELFKHIISKAVDESIAGSTAVANSANCNIQLKLSTDIEDVKDYIDGLNLNANIQYDRNAKEAVASLAANKGSSNYLNSKAMVDLSNKFIVFGDENFYDKIIKKDITDDIEASIEKELGQNYSFTVDAKARKKSAKILNNTIDKNIDDKWFSESKVVTEIEGKQKKVKDNVFCANEKEIINSIKNITKSLKLSNEFLNGFSNRELTEKILDNIDEYLDDSYNNDLTIHIYTGSFNKFYGIALVEKDNEASKYGKYENIIEVTKKKGNNYEIAVEVNDNGDIETKEKINVKINELNDKGFDLEISQDIEDEGNYTIDLSYNQLLNGNIQLLDTQNSINYNDLTDEDKTNIIKNVEKSDLFKEISSLGINTLMNNFSSIDETQNGELTIDKGKSKVESFDGDVVIFEVPNSFDELYSGSSYVRFSKEDTTKSTAYVDVDCESSSLEEYEEELENKVKLYQEGASYQNVNLSERKEKVVGNITFYVRTFSYTYGDYTSSRVYYYTKINDDYTYAIQVEDDDGIISENEIEKLLTLNIKLAN